ncbi:MAG: protein translocase subunit SecD [Acidobacteria bacterium]|nr:protein translocase subunit SecD [Acidobacteriota bacterium]
MYKNLRWKVIAILAVTGLSVAAFYPLNERLKLGLDLQGGIEMVLRVNTEEALTYETETTAAQLQESMTAAGIITTAVRTTGLTTFVVEGVATDRDAQFRQLAQDQIGLVFDREAGVGGTYTFRMRPNLAVSRASEAVAQAIQTIDRRVNELGVSEPIVAPYGNDGNQIVVQLPGVTDIPRAKEMIGRTAMLELKLVEQGPTPDEATLLATTGGAVPPDMEIVPGLSNGVPSFYLVRRLAAVTGNDLRTARATVDSFNQPAVSFTLNSQAASRFGDITGSNLGRQLAIILDGRVESAPVIEGRISSEGQITGTFTQREVSDLSMVLRSGALPASLTPQFEDSVGPSLGRDSIDAGVRASVAGLILVALFIVVYYKRAGVNAVIVIALNLIILLGFMSYIGAVMTLPGIAGFILTIGMGVDSNVLIFERIREELANGKGARQAVAAGFDRVFVTILDTHVTSLIAAAFLFQFGTGPIKGFATTLFFGLISNVFTAVFASRTLFEVSLSRRPGTAKLSI